VQSIAIEFSFFSDDYPSSSVIHKSEVWKDGNGDGVSVIDAGDKV
jgi:hypothetical protein